MSRFLPHGHDPNVHKEEVITLARTTSQQQGIPKVNGFASPTSNGTTTAAADAPRRKHFVFTDPVAFRYDNARTSEDFLLNACRYLEEDSATAVIERRGRLKGYELYIVEQWACSRVHPTFVITTYTGDDKHNVTVGVLGVPVDEETWSPRLRVYFKAISQFHARPKETPLGMLMVTNLSSFPSALTVIPVPNGDVRSHREDFIVNENLKRLGCSGRSGMSLAAPAGATQAKFQQLYRTSDRIPLYGAVIELVKLCQVALMIFGKLEQEYADGMLCDVTEKAISDWWTEIGAEHYNTEPTDGILGPTTVAALLGLLLGSRNRLNYYGAPVSKDAFDVFNLKRGIAYFQKAQKIDRTRRLDRVTLSKLQRVTAKAAAGEGWAVPKAVKSTVAELSGKGGEMVLGMVGRGDKAGIGDIETVNLDQFVELAHGERAKWLWYGKPRRSGTALDRAEHIGANFTFAKDEQGGYIWSHSRQDSVPPEDDFEDRRKQEDSPQPAVYSQKPPGSTNSIMDSPNDKEKELRKTVFKSVTGKMSDAKSGLGRIKDAVGLRGHVSRPSKDDIYGTDQNGDASIIDNSSTTLAMSSTAPSSPAMINKAFTWKNTPIEYQNGVPKEIATPAALSTKQKSAPPNVPIIKEPTRSPPRNTEVEDLEADSRWAAQVHDIRRELGAVDGSVGGSTNGEEDPEPPLLDMERDRRNLHMLLRRRRSIAETSLSTSQCPHEARWPRQMSFSDIEEVVLTWDSINVPEDISSEGDTWLTWTKQMAAADAAKDLFQQLSELQDHVGPWAEKQVNEIMSLDEQAAEDQEQLHNLYYQLTEQYEMLKQNSHDLLEQEKAHITDSVRDIEVMGAKLEYEINGLISKVQDVEDGVAQYEAQVAALEDKALELEMQLRTESWPHWIMRKLTGIGTGPNIVEAKM